jgi:methylmalonyl-CoA/ethylmalonyl-CoA epimerase
MSRLFSAVDHVGIAVADLDEAIAWYARTFGMRVVHVEVNEEMGVREAMLQVGDDPSGTQLQLLAPLRADTTIGRFLDRFGPGIQQLAYRVDDLDAVTATLQERGLLPLYEAPRRGTAGARVNFIHPKDAGGVLVELIEPARSDVLGEQ